MNEENAIGEQSRLTQMTTRCGWFHALISYKVWSYMGWMLIRNKYARTSIGPFWVPVLASMTGLLLATVYGALWGISVAEFFPYIFSGLVIWSLIASLILDGVTAIQSQGSILKNTTICPATAGLSIFWRNCLSFAMTYPLILVVSTINPGFSWWSVPVSLLGVVIALSLLAPLMIILAYIGVRVADLSQVLQPVMLAFMLISPVFWPASQLPANREFLASLNPFNWLISVIRSPLFGVVPPANQWLGLLLLAVLMNIAVSKVIRKASLVKIAL